MGEKKMEKITHIAVGSVAGMAVDKAVSGTLGPYAALLGGVVAVLPDLDIVLPFLKHRGITHSIWAVIVAGLAVGALLGMEAGIVAAAAVASHILIDLPNYAGVQVLWPKEAISFGWFKGDNIAINALMILACAIILVLAYGNLKVVV